MVGGEVEVESGARELDLFCTFACGVIPRQRGSRGELLEVRWNSEVENLGIFGLNKLLVMSICGWIYGVRSVDLPKLPEGCFFGGSELGAMYMM